MDIDKKSFLIYLDYKEHFDLLTDEQLGQLMRVIMEYEATGEEPKIDGVLKMAFSFIKKQLDRDREKWQEQKSKKSEAGKKGMAKRWANTAKDNTDNNDNSVITKDNNDNSVKNEITEITVTDTVTDNVTVTDIYPSYHPSEDQKEVQDEIDVIGFDKIVEQSQVELYNKDLVDDITNAMKELYLNPSTKKTIEKVKLKHIDYAVANFKDANSKENIKKPKEYFKKCLLSAINETGLANTT